MTEPRPQKITILKKYIADSVDRAAEALRRDFEAGHRQAAAKIDLPDGRKLSFKLYREEPPAPFRIDFDRDFAPCDNCQRAIGDELRGYKGGSNRLHLFLREAMILAQACGCIYGGAQPRQLESARLPAVSQGGAGRQLIRVSPAARRHAPEVRVREVEGDAWGEARTGEADAREAEALGRTSAPLELTYALPDSQKVSLIILGQAAEAIVAHCRESNRHGQEVGGMIVGYSNEARTAAGAGGDFHLIATDIVPFQPFDSSHAHLVLDEEAWLSIGRAIDSMYTPQGKVRLGWYHTHPTQGILFSEPDIDTHTSFRQPQQFAIVVDPRSMEAGLYYWADHAEQRLDGPVRFALAADPASHAALRAAEPNRTVGARAERVSAARLYLALAFIVGLTSYLLIRAGWRALTPDEASLLALSVLAGLTLWNAGAFSAYSETEARLARSLRKLVGRASAGLWARLATVPPKVFIIIITVLVLALLALILRPLFRSSGQQDVGGQSSSAQAGATAGQRAAGGGQGVKGGEVGDDRPRKLVQIKVEELRTQDKTLATVALTSPVTGQTMIYQVAPAQGGNNFTPSKPEEEQEFVRNVFTDPEIKALQAALNVSTNQTNTGVWGPKTRAAFLARALGSRESGKPLEVALQGGNTLSIEFK